MCFFCRSYYLSIFEIYSEKGKGEKMYDLSADGGELTMQQFTIKGLKEVIKQHLFCMFVFWLVLQLVCYIY